jgi:hypothetical protein
MEVRDIIITIGTSSAVTGIATLFFKTSVTESIKSHFTIKMEELKFQNQLKLEMLKNEIEISSERTRQQSDETKKVFTSVIELAYRIRNTARELSKDCSSQQKISQLYMHIHGIEESLYANRLMLEKIHYFLEFHSFKNKCLYFADMVDAKLNENDDRDLSLAYKDIEEGFNHMISKTVIE